MSTIVSLLAGSAVFGSIIGLKYSVLTMVGLAPLLGFVTMLAARDVFAMPAACFAFACACVFVSETASLLGAWLQHSRPPA
jgi:hypothetical protein